MDIAQRLAEIGDADVALAIEIGKILESPLVVLKLSVAAAVTDGDGGIVETDPFDRIFVFGRTVKDAGIQVESCGEGALEVGDWAAQDFRWFAFLLEVEAEGMPGYGLGLEIKAAFYSQTQADSIQPRHA